MKTHNQSHARYVVVAAVMIAMLAASCGGGGAGLPAPGAPQPQQQQPQQQQPPQPPPPQQQQLPPQQPQASPPDAGKIAAVFNDQQMEFYLTGSPGAVMANARVVIEDPQNFVESMDAQADGSFQFGTYDVPPNFMTAPGTAIRVYQFDDGTLRSEPATVTIQLVSTP
jgi:hypothetical protein